jgi:hypothetical protein
MAGLTWMMTAEDGQASGNSGRIKQAGSFGVSPQARKRKRNCSGTIGIVRRWLILAFLLPAVGGRRLAREVEAAAEPKFLSPSSTDSVDHGAAAAPPGASRRRSRGMNDGIFESHNSE